MMDNQNNQVELINQKSFVNQKFNLQNTEANEVFLIPTFTLIATPVISAENISCYELFFQINYLYCQQSTKLKKEFGVISNLIFQYDLNFSKEQEARGQIKLFNYVQFSLVKDKKLATTLVDVTDLKNHKHVDFLPPLWLTIFKILLPVKAIKKDDINVLHYSFNTTKNDFFPNTSVGELNKNLHINNKNNSGTLDFYINNNPKYQLQSVPKILSKEINILTIKNPLIFQTFIPKINNDYNFTAIKNNNKLAGLINGKSLIDENFTFIFNNLNSLSVFPLKVQHYLSANKDDSIFNSKKIFDTFNNFLFHQTEFNLQQSLALNIIEDNNNLGFKKINGNLLISNAKSSNQEYINFQEYFLKLNYEIYSPLEDKFLEDFSFPYDQKLKFTAGMPLKFETFFKYDINFNFIEHSNSAIIGDKNSLIKTSVSDKRFKDVKWTQKDEIILSYSQIKEYYINNNFNFDDYQSLLNGRGNNGL